MAEHFLEWYAHAVEYAANLVELDDDDDDDADSIDDDDNADIDIE